MGGLKEQLARLYPHLAAPEAKHVVARMNASENIVRLSRDLGICRTLLYKWRYQLEPADTVSGGAAPTKGSREPTLRREIGKLKQLLGLASRCESVLGIRGHTEP